MLAEDRARLQKIDELYALRLDQYVSLPQSSGKSSVLEGLTNLPFPRDSGLCTRFPTQIVFKRSASESKVVSIMAIHGQEKSRADAIAKFGKRQVTSLDERAFSDLLAEASECMGIALVGKQEDSHVDSFSHNILKFELSGPEFENFSVIDLPGIFRKPTPGQTSKADIPLVREMIAKYLGNPRSIILAIVPANVDIATQEIIQIAEDADPGGQRTLGVLTKPDLVDRGAEDKIMELVANREGSTKVDLGYTIDGHPMTMNHYFADNLRKAREDRIRRRFASLETWATKDTQREPLLRLKDTLAMFMSNDGQSAQDLHDTLEAYYKVARKRFVDAICLQAVDHFLISSKYGPLWLFSPQFIGTLTDIDLNEIAGEGHEAVSRRERLIEEIESLKAGQRILAN
ncbi:hypothetical protein WAI453_013580 [Rhynchosporium graminicola]